MNDALGGKNLPALRHRAEPCRAIQRRAAVTAVGRDRLATVEPHTDAEREWLNILTRRAESPLQRHGGADRLPGPAKHAQRLIPAQLKQLALELGHRLGTRSANRPASADAASSPCSCVKRV